jgi:hypothetical protein
MIRRIARNKALSITYKLHAQERLIERGLIVSDVLYALKSGFVYDDPTPAMGTNCYKYLMTCKTPNSGSRSIGLIVIPSLSDCDIKIVTVMWMDEYERVAGSIIGEENE